MKNIFPSEFESLRDFADTSICQFILQKKVGGFTIGEPKMSFLEMATIDGGFLFSGLHINGTVQIANVSITHDFFSEISSYKNIDLFLISKGKVWFNSDTIADNMNINLRASHLQLIGCVIGRLLIGEFAPNRIQYINLTNTVLNSDSRIYASGVRAIDLSGLKIIGDHTLDIDINSDRDSSNNKKIAIRLLNTPLDKVILNFKNFTLDTSFISRAKIQTIYENLLTKYKSDNDEDNYSIVDKEYRYWEYHTNHALPFLIPIFWYGHDFLIHSKKAFSFLLTFLMFATLVNFFIYKRMNKEVYNLRNFPPFGDNPRHHPDLFVNMYNGFIYTIVIFFSLNVKFENLYFKKVLLLLWFFTIYLAGYWFLFLMLKELKLN